MPSHDVKYGNFFKFEKDDIIRNRIKTFPKVEFFIYTGSVYYNNSDQSFENSHTPPGHMNLYDFNVYRDLHDSPSDEQLIYPFITKQGSFAAFKTISADSLNLDFVLGDEIKKTYPLTASISVNRYSSAASSEKLNVLHALKNTLNYHKRHSIHYAYSSHLGDKETQPLNIISIPSIFYGSGINRGSVRLKFYVSGSLIAEASDTKRNGELLQTSGNIASNIGKQIGVVLYNEGFIILTASYDLDNHQEVYEPGSGSDLKNSSWHYFGTTNSHVNAPSSSFAIQFEGVNFINTVTMFAHAKKNELNYSNNPTFLKKISGDKQSLVASGSNFYLEDGNDTLQIKNIVSSSHTNYSASFEPVTYISKIGIYDENKNLIAIAGLANPVKKTESRNYTFKLKLDI
mgnify:CR=1 FL=1